MCWEVSKIQVKNLAKRQVKEVVSLTKYSRVIIFAMFFTWTLETSQHVLGGKSMENNL